MKKSTHLLLLATSILFLSSCASIFEGRNYSHLHYVKVKKEHPEIVQSNPVQKDNVQSIVNKEEQGLSIAGEQAPVQMKSFTQKQSASNENHKAGSTEQHQSAGNTIGSIIKNPVDLFSKKEQYKIESETHELFGDLDHDLRMALIFGIVGIVVLFFVWVPDVGFVFAIIGSILILIAIIYLIMYLVENG